MKFLLRFSQPLKNAFKLGLKFPARGCLKVSIEHGRKGRSNEGGEVPIINEWYALMNFLLRFSQPLKNAFKLGLKFPAIKGLLIAFLPKKQLPRVIPTGLPPGPDAKSERRDMRAPGSNTISAMTATVVPTLSPGSPGPNVLQMTAVPLLPRLH
ncbi:hypothetical protein ACLB2K_053788 [Fragaria x ananassa]